MRIRLISNSTALLLLFIGAKVLAADTVYFDVLNQEIEGPNTGLVPGAAIWGDNAEFDLNSDGQMDVLFRHGFEGQPFGISRSAFNLLQNAETGLQQTNAALFQIRDVLLQAANEPNSESLARWQQQIDMQVEMLRTISRDTGYGGSISFSHAPARYAFTTTPETIEAIGASSETQIGVYDFAVSTPGERANIVALTRQDAALHSAETLF